MLYGAGLVGGVPVRGGGALAEDKRKPESGVWAGKQRGDSDPVSH